MNSKNIIFIIAFLYISFFHNNAFGQDYKPFSEFGSNLYGLKERKTGRVIIPPKYDHIYEYRNGLLSVYLRDYGYAVIDLNEKIIVPYSAFYTRLVTSEDTSINKYFIESSFISPNRDLPVIFYLIDTNRTCIPFDYMPCPAWKDSVSINVNDYLNAIQGAVNLHYINKIDSIGTFSNMAIKLSPTNPYVYFSKAQLMLLNRDWEQKKLKDFNSTYEIDSIVYYLNIADSLETNISNKIFIKTTKINIYRDLLDDRENIRSTKKELGLLDASIHRSGLFLTTSVNYVNNIELEVGISYGAFNNKTKYNFHEYVQQGIVWIGASYMKHLSPNIDGYKIYLLSFQQPVCAGIYPILYTDYNKTEFVVRPEIGIGYNIWSFSLGYNIHVKGTRFDEITGITLCLKAFIPLLNKRVYFKD
jgi:hypothetical protein